tara:strand:+ start:810 stop:983 length:174 start_codon:yes stop_codon:yes gene_type:complete
MLMDDGRVTDLQIHQQNIRELQGQLQEAYQRIKALVEENQQLKETIKATEDKVLLKG